MRLLIMAVVTVVSSSFAHAQTTQMEIEQRLSEIYHQLNQPRVRKQTQRPTQFKLDQSHREPLFDKEDPLKRPSRNIDPYNFRLRQRSLDIEQRPQLQYSLSTEAARLTCRWLEIEIASKGYSAYDAFSLAQQQINRLSRQYDYHYEVQQALQSLANDLTQTLVSDQIPSDGAQQIVSELQELQRFLEELR